MKFALASRCLSEAEMGNAENSFKINPYASGLFETWSAVYLRTASPVRRSKIKGPIWLYAPTRRAPSAAAFRLQNWH
jgi:hypothetical protein